MMINIEIRYFDIQEYPRYDICCPIKYHDIPKILPSTTVDHCGHIPGYV